MSGAESTAEDRAELAGLTLVRQLRRATGFCDRTDGAQDAKHIAVGLVDGHIFSAHPALANARIVELDSSHLARSDRASAHATHSASILVGQGGWSLGLCCGVRLFSSPVADDDFVDGRLAPAVAARRIASAISALVEAGAFVIQLGFEFAAGFERAFDPAAQAIAAAAARGVRTVVPAGNSSSVASSAILGVAGVVPVAMGDGLLRPTIATAMGLTIGTRGLLAPGLNIPGAIPPDGFGCRSGSSFAASFVTGAIVALRRQFPFAARGRLWHALLNPAGSAARSIVARPLDLEAASEVLRAGGWFHSTL